ncbi:beta-galactosidase trimerization domain-containing protein [Saccharopolyspora erythraea]|uniref:beta-galactosidase trimerization domain-containing protein n=1 Tax=Saccharopolyspora erythraea TaxID=1836 RepID=UPI001BAA7E80|nr:beta-galactosidase trimerization domain-containing protein [Saccharopolyspora erythraea]QUH01392.1 beta-galactosidase trimerization domain-containing protein [Saccharopolyspora erythraea]
MRRNSAKVRVDGEPAVWLGANFWSRTGGPLMWRNYDPAVVRSELEVLAENGLRQTRSFFYWPDFMPEPDRIDEEKAAHFADFLDAHTEIGMTSIPTFIVGHMSGDNWDPAWRGGRDLYADVWLVARQAWFVERMSERFAGHPAVAGWLISNEMPIYGRLRHEPVAPAEHVLSWAQLMVQAVRAGGARQPVSLGDGAWGIEVTGVDNGFSVRDTGALVDFVGPHVYRMDSDPVRQHLNAAFVCELSAVAGKPVVLEEFGLSSDHVSAQNAGHYYRQTLHTSLLAGATGWLAWNNTDYDGLVAQEPYSHHPFEMHFGITDHTGAPKPPLLELDSFARTLDAVDFPRCSRTDTEVALLVSEYLEHGYPYAQADDRPLIFTTLRQGYVAAREADLPVGFVRERDGVEDCALYLLPCVKQVQGPTWLALRERVAAGSVLYLSYCAGEVEHHRGAWLPYLDETFGVEKQLAYGLVDAVEDEHVEFTFTEDFGGIEAGEVLRFRVGGNEHSRTFLPVVPRGAKVVATDAHGRPALLRHVTGEGQAVLCTYPLEHFAASNARVNPEPTYRIYAALAAVAGVRRPVVVDRPEVFADALVHEDGRRFAWLVGQNAEPITVTPRVEGSLHDLVTGAEVPEIELLPYGVRVLELRPSPELP